MPCSAAKLSFKNCALRAVGVLLATGGAAALLVFFAWLDQRPILFQSTESKTADGGPVFNRIRYQPGSRSDIWIMQQSHFGPDAPDPRWDRIAITVRHGVRRTADFAQLEPGPLTDPEGAREVEKKARCYMCHANGPRAIRPIYRDALVEVSRWDRWRIFLWNLRIKTYGRFAPTVQDRESGFRVQSGLANEPLQVPACRKCHGEMRDTEQPTGVPALVARGALRRQHYAAIDFMVTNGLMPPPGYPITEEEKREVMFFTGRLTAGP